MRLSRKLVNAAAALVLLGAVSTASAMGPIRPGKDLRLTAVAAVSEDATVAKAARAKLRAAGPEGLAALEFQFRPEINKALQGTQPADDPAWARIRAALDAVAAQRDAYASSLYWYTDLEQAKAAARDSGLPILSLRLLGTLDSELSCANSRFFRTALYANREVAQFLEGHFILHWQSVRPVPRVTIDMGDGRVIYRTITGNSIHYVLDAEGRPVDAVPGLYGPAAFVRTATAALEAEQKLRGMNSADRANALALWHSERVRATDDQWRTDLDRLGVSAAVTPAFPPLPAAPPAGPVSARVAVEAAIPKAAAAERTIVREVVPAPSHDEAIRAEAAALLSAARQRSSPTPSTAVAPQSAAPAPSAKAAAPVAIGKYVLEERIVKEVVTDPTPAAPIAEPVEPPAPPANRAARVAIGKRQAEVRIVNEVVGAPADGAPVVEPARLPAPPANQAAKLAVGKGKAEVRIVDEVVGAPAALPVAAPPASQASKQTVGKRREEMRLVNEVVGAPAEPQQRPAAAEPAANVAAPRARGKALVETRIVNEVVRAPITAPPAVDLAGATTPDVWLKIAALHAADAKLDDGSRKLMRSKIPPAKAAALLTATKSDVEDPLVRTIANFERSVAEDTVRNEYTFHRQIHIWFGQQQPESANVDALNKRVYAELFLTPDTDPWLGLIPSDTYSALQDDGMSEASLHR